MHLKAWSICSVGRILFLLILSIFGCGGDENLPATHEKVPDKAPTVLPPKTTDLKTLDIKDKRKIRELMQFQPLVLAELFPPTQQSGQVQTIDLGKIEFTNGESSNYTVNIPQGAIAFVVVIAGYPGVMYMVKELKNPVGTVLAAGIEMGKHLNRVMPGVIGGSTSFLVPNTPDIAKHFVPGQYSFSLTAFVTKGFSQAPDNNPAKGYAFIKMGPAIAQGSLDVNILCTTAGGITAANALTTPRVKDMLAGWKDLYAKANIQLGKINFFDIDPVFKKLESIQGANSDLAKACRTTKDKPIAVNVVLTDGISMGGILGGLGVIMGVSGGIPATVMVNGLESSCLAISLTAPAKIDKDLAPITVAHEAGHFLGLFHSSESALGALTGMKHDPISDTPENDKNNVMFNNPLEAANPYFSPMQGIVMRSNPLVY